MLVMARRTPRLGPRDEEVVVVLGKGSLGVVTVRDAIGPATPEWDQRALELPKVDFSPGA